jgi:transglutaminase-like putative cysteine protease
MEMDVQLTVPADQLPTRGTVDAWLFAPIEDEFQTDVSIISARPQAYVKHINRDEIGNVYFEIPVEAIEGDLAIDLRFQWTRYQQRVAFDPAQIAGTWSYDPVTRRFSFPGLDPAFYERWTGDTENVAVTPAVRERAVQIVDDYLAASGRTELNPYQAARAMYDYMVAEVDYSHLPWLTVSVLQRHGEWDPAGNGYLYDGRAEDGVISKPQKLGVPASEYVLARKYGDCGAQGALFAALCRAVGIPASDLGGYQTLLPEEPSGHFWSAFYLPVHGWVLVDPSIGQSAAYLHEYGQYAGDREMWAKRTDFFFGGQDPYRLDIQFAVDLPFVPEPKYPSCFPITLQGNLIQALERTPSETPLLNYIQTEIQYRETPAGGREEPGGGGGCFLRILSGP